MRTRARRPPVSFSPAGHFKQIIPTAEEDNIFDDIDLLEQDRQISYLKCPDGMG